MMLSMRTEYALRALFELSLAEEGQAVTRSEVAQRQKIPVHFLGQIFLALKKAGLIKTVKGPGGGYVLAREKDAINVWDIYKAVDHVEHEGQQCFPAMKQECDQIASCRIKGVWFKLNKVIQESLSQMTLKDLATGQI